MMAIYVSVGRFLFIKYKKDILEDKKAHYK